MIYPELVISDLPHEAMLKDKLMSTKKREFCYWLLSNRSRRVLALSDDELVEVVRELIRGVEVDLDR